MRVETRISLVYGEEKEAEAILKSISPDNIDLPKGLMIRTFTEKRKLIAHITYDEDNILTLRSTIDDLLSCISVAEKTLASLRRKSGNTTN
ncbi:hypothetical protein DRO37_08965 [Candidatus Bathyarchaeota archaeon]|nr:MAG: hypothetical protein DRO37_08965 [Candidatus Bathyarchaeota archaeon]